MTDQPRLTHEDLRGSSARRRRETMVRTMFLAAAGVSVVISALIILSLVGEAWNFISHVDPANLRTDGWFPRRDMFDIATIVAGTLAVAGVGLLVAIPLGLGAAIYLAEYASPRLRGTLKPILEMLAAVPSVVLGFFALVVISPTLVQPVCDVLTGGSPIFSMGAAGLAVGILITPLVASIAEDAMYAVPNSLREAAFGLGARKRATSLRIVIPAAVSGIMAAIIVGASRAIGETMIVAMAAGGTGGSLFQLNPCQPGQTMTAAITALATGSDRVRGADLAYPSLFFVGILLFAFTLVLNMISERFVRRVRLRY
ncbi:MAG TPA: phosphate ABC transporter permease subunit PstC [Candidatus Limnocylindria bacterium]